MERSVEAFITALNLLVSVGLSAALLRVLSAFLRLPSVPLRPAARPAAHRRPARVYNPFPAASCRCRRRARCHSFSTPSCLALISLLTPLTGASRVRTPRATPSATANGHRRKQAACLSALAQCASDEHNLCTRRVHSTQGQRARWNARRRAFAASAVAVRRMFCVLGRRAAPCSCGAGRTIRQGGERRAAGLGSGSLRFEPVPLPCPQRRAVGTAVPDGGAARRDFGRGECGDGISLRRRRNPLPCCFPRSRDRVSAALREAVRPLNALRDWVRLMDVPPFLTDS